MSINRAVRSLAYALLTGLALPSLAQGQWLPQGVPICTASAGQRNPGVVPDGIGGSVIFWVDGRELRPDLYAQRVTADGRISPGWPIDGVFLSGLVGDLGLPVGISDGTGGAIVVWEDERDVQTSLYNIYAQRVTGEGTVAPGWPVDGFPVCTAPHDQRVPRLVSDGQGGAYITWEDARNDPGGPNPIYDIFAQRVTADGKIASGWQVDGIPICTNPEGQARPTLTSDQSGGILISWVDARNFDLNKTDIYAQRITSGAEIAPGWVPDGVAICAVLGHQSLPETVSDGEGGAILIWLDARSEPDADFEPDWDIYAQRITGDGTPAPGWPRDGVPLSTAPGIQWSLSAAADGLGGAVVAWDDYRCQANSSMACGVYAQRITAEGLISGDWPAHGLETGVFEFRPALAPDGSGGAFVVGRRGVSGGFPDIYAQHVTASGEIASGWDRKGLPVCVEPHNQEDPAVAADGIGGAIVAWTDFRNGNNDIFAHKLGIDGPVPVLLSLVATEFEVDQVLLTWHGVGAASLAAVVHRRMESVDWETIGFPSTEGPDRLRYEDRSVVRGTRYAYRLAYRDEAAERFTVETWVDVPAMALSLAGFRPNPAIGRASLAFSLPDDRPARLEVIDVKGRVVHSSEVGSLGGGAHVLQLAGGTPLAAGMYSIRLTHPERTLTTKGLVAK